MRFPGKKQREAVGATRRDIDFDHYSWDTPKEKGWHPMVVLNAQEKETSKGDPMWVVDLGIDNPDGSGARVRWHVPSTFMPKVTMCLEVLLPEHADAEEDIDIDPKVMMFRACVGLIDIDPSFEREDGEPAWTLVKIIKTNDAAEELGEDWNANHAAPGSNETADAEAPEEADVF